MADEEEDKVAIIERERDILEANNDSDESEKSEVEVEEESIIIEEGESTDDEEKMDKSRQKMNLTEVQLDGTSRAENFNLT